MSAKHPTPDNLRTIADNLHAEGQTSRAEVIYNAADRLELLEVGADKLTADYVRVTIANIEVASLNADLQEHIAAMRAALDAAREVIKARHTSRFLKAVDALAAALDGAK